MITILTAAHGPSPHLEETAEAVLAQDTDDWEWLVQEDGPDPRLRDRLPTDHRVRYSANGAQLGVAMTRNIALSRARGWAVRVLDHDDLLLPHALRVAGQRLRSETPLGWTIAQADDLVGESRVPYPPRIKLGAIPAGYLTRHASIHKGNWWLHAAGLTARTSLVRALGGWAATPVDDDLSLLAALSEMSDGWHEPAVTWLYRRHADQLHASREWTQWGEIGRTIALQRAAAVRAIGLRLESADAGELGVHTITAGPAAKQ